MGLSNSLISQNRAEELGYDIWEDFVIPPFYDSLDLFSAKKPIVIVGGRGCGKTSLLRYLCHQTQFSPKRIEITQNDLRHVGIYWKADTQFAKILSKRGVDDDFWNRAFEHMAVLIMSQEILKSLESVAESAFGLFNFEDLSRLNFAILNSFFSEIPSNFHDLKLFIRRQLNYFQTWVGSIRSLEQPIFLPKSFVVELISEIKSQNKSYKDTNFFVYVDEYENLISDQQRLINTWLKHSEMPLIFNLAMKPYSFDEKKTIGNEQLVEIHDYREYDLEKYYIKINFQVFASEILFLRLSKNDDNFQSPIELADLKTSSRSILEKRRAEDYKTRVLNFAREMFPGLSLDKTAERIFSDEILLRRLRSLIEQALSKKKIALSVNEFLLEDFPQAGVVIPALLNRNISIRIIQIEIDKLKAGHENKFTGSTGWIHNNVFGCLLLIYEPLGRYCPLYSGFDAFCSMSRTNLRHFLELCNKSISNEILNNRDKNFKHISIKSQAEAAKQASASFLREVKNFGINGNKLHTFVLRIGTYFSYSQKKLGQSEPEQNHFSVKGTFSTELDLFIRDAVKWSVLYESRITKQKGGSAKFEQEDYEYVLNPIYAPYFHISYRKKRSLIFDLTQINVIAFGSYEQFEKLLKQSFKASHPMNNEFNGDLFSNLAE